MSLPHLSRAALAHAAWSLGSLAALVAPATAQDAGSTVFEAGRVWLAPGSELEGADARFAVRDGKVVAVGDGISPDFAANARIVSLGDATVVPGFVLAHHHLDQANDLAETIDAFTPHLRVDDAFDPFGEKLAELPHGGVTAVALAPVSRNTFAGQAALVRPGEERGSIARTGIYLKLALVDESLDQDRYPTSRMGAADLMRAAFAEAANPLGLRTPETATLRAALAGDLPVAVHARTLAEVTTALATLGEVGIQPVLLDVRDVDEILPRLRGSATTVVVPPLGFASKRELLELPARLEAEAIPFSFLADDGHAARRSAALAIRHGLSPRTALAALTRVPATQCGVDDMVGSLTVGHAADFAVFDGDPTDLSSRLLAVHVGGQRIHGAADAGAAPEEETR